MANIHVLTEQLTLLVESPDTFPGTEEQKVQLLRLARQAAASLESPFETLQRLVYSVRTLALQKYGLLRYLGTLACTTLDGVR